MDDLTVTTSSVPGSRWILQGLESRSLVLKKGKVVDKFRFKISETTIPTLSEKPVKSLGKVFDCNLKDKVAREPVVIKESGLPRLSGLPGHFKVWIYQHAILPMVLWPLLPYDVPKSTVDALEKKISSYLRRWLGVPRSMSSAALYGSTNTLQLPFSGLSEEFVVTRTREASTETPGTPRWQQLALRSVRAGSGVLPESFRWQRHV